MTVDVDAAPAHLVGELVAAWARVRHHRLAHLVDRVAGQLEARPALGASKKAADLAAWRDVAAANDPADFDRLAAAMRGGSQEDVRNHVVTLAERSDPRFARALLALLEKPPYAGVKSRSLLAAILDALAATRDHRAAGPARDLSGRYLGIVSSGTGGWIVTRLAEVAGELDAVVEPELGELAAACDALEKRFGKPAAITDNRRTLEQLLAEIYAAPDDDGPRLVYADALLERGDPRGEHITLQIGRARGTLSPEGAARLVEIEANAKQLTAWAQPLANGGYCKLERGFPVEIELFRTAKTIETNPALATLEHVRALGAPPQRTALAILDATNLRSVAGCPAAVLEKAAVRQRPWRKLGVIGTPSARALAAVPELVELDIVADDPLGTLGSGLAGLRLRKLVLRQRVASGPFALPATLEALELDCNELPMTDFAGVGALVTLRLDYLQRPAQLALPASLRELTLRARERDSALPAIRGARDVAVLRVSDIASFGDGLAAFGSLEHLQLEKFGPLAPGTLAGLGGLRSLDLRARDVPPDAFAPLVSLRELSVRGPVEAPPRLAGLSLEQLHAPWIEAAQLSDPQPRLARAHVTTSELAAIPPFLARHPALERFTLGVTREVAQQSWTEPLRALAASRVAHFRLEYGGTYRGHDWLELERDGDGSLSRTTVSGESHVVEAIRAAIHDSP